MLMNILSLYISLDSKIIYHDNGNNLLSKGFIDINKHQSQFVHTLHFIPINADISKHPTLGSFGSIIYVTKYAQEYLAQKKHYIERVIYNGVREVIIDKTKKTLRLKYGFNDSEILILYVGRIEESKGITFLAKLFSEMGLENARLVIVGSGAYDLVFEKIEANHSKITFLGNIDNQEVHNLMAACDIGVIPSLNEQCSYVALEMMSHGMAIIASEVRGMGELFMGRDIALTVPVDYTDDIPTLDTDVLKQHIITFAGDVGLRKRLGANARREWAEHYTAERMARETFEVYKELAAQF
ncbi:Glycosyltransferase [Mucinivorans hirudinis]|uniref:Glycosyltransferase n=1 Tax=Mucinivorans hirudinis TaxID=1433126 RepID=A0A060R6D3_9BACT|nr:Glycosyltransferase [Mucinivorans hirudinis]